MKVIKKPGEKIKIEDAHGGEGKRKLLIGDGEIKNVQGMTFGYLPIGGTFSMHTHDDLDEIMLVLSGEGYVRDDDGKHSFKSGDVFVFPKGVQHEQVNTGNTQIEFIFVRVR